MRISAAIFASPLIIASMADGSMKLGSVSKRLLVAAQSGVFMAVKQASLSLLRLAAGKPLRVTRAVHRSVEKSTPASL